MTTPVILNVRLRPGLDYDILATVPKGTQARIIGIGPDGEWYKIMLDALSDPAWAYVDLTTVEGFLGCVKQHTSAELDGHTSTDVVCNDNCSANPIAITIPAVLIVSRGPGTEYVTIGNYIPK